MTDQHPYKNLPDWADWRRSVADRNMFHIADLWQPRFNITKSMRIATFGSCFAQHIGRSMKERGFSWLNCEPAPPGLSKENAKRFNYNIFSARTGNIYTSSILKQWTEWAAGIKAPPDEVWKKNGRFIDPFRPRIEPDGFESVEEMVANRAVTIDRFRQCIEQADVFVFTLGLTESWFNKSGGYEYPLCPGTAAGTFDEAEHVFINQGYEAVRSSLVEALSIMRNMNPGLRFLLTVSPVPLVATNAGRHVLVSTMASKSVLRAVADSVAGTTIEPRSGRTKLKASWKDWAIYGEHEISDGALYIRSPGSNPFYGIKRRTPLNVVEDDKVLVRVEAESDATIVVHVSPNLTTRKDSISASLPIKDGVAEFEFPVGWTGNAAIWLRPERKTDSIKFKSIAVSRQSDTDGFVDYFPSYEIINSPAFGGVFFERDRREVSPYGVNFVMNHFFSGLGEEAEKAAAPKKKDDFDVICDELILGSFSKAAE
ncbi:GSCFA domain-containing protein [Pararhizobium polonicum]|uniref:GSCFA domain-containing protein n=1 Tax=Pararhizobium polonicum TaxID=1612624 RepID=UPI0009F22DFE|nr:GSCFA domain-containing protein [Pararhizobium polonicum]